MQTFKNLQVSISPTFYEHLLHAQIPKAQKIQLSWQSFLHFRDLHIKAALKQWWNWHQWSIHQHSTSSFYAFISWMLKKDRQLYCLFVLSGSERIKAACRTLVKLTPDVSHCINSEGIKGYLIDRREIIWDILKIISGFSIIGKKLYLNEFLFISFLMTWNIIRL